MVDEMEGVRWGVYDSHLCMLVYEKKKKEVFHRRQS
jgi:hypothetical protein